MSEVPAALLHVYAQEYWHDEAHIIANRAGLLQLKAAVDRALEKGAGIAGVYTSDGEGYHCLVVQANDVDIDGLRLPYTGEVAIDKRKDFDPPYKLAKTIVQQSLEGV